MHVHLIRDTLRPGEDLTVERLEQVRDEVYGGTWPAQMAFYDGQVAEDRRLPTETPAQIDALYRHPGPLVAVHYPADFVTGLVAAVGAIIGLLVGFLLPKPKAPTLNQRNTRGGSPNNGLGERGNEARPGERIADIYGTLRAYPDQIALPYRLYEGHREFEIAYDCLGRGTYDIAEDEVYDGDTRVADITGARVEVYGPNTSPNSGSAQLTIGSAIGTAVLDVREVESVDGQELRAPNADRVKGNSSLKFVAPDQIVRCSNSFIEFDAVFAVDDTVIVSDAAIDTDLDFEGTYTVAAVDTESITFDNPSAVAPGWDNLGTDGETACISPEVRLSPADRWEGWFDVIHPERTKLICNFVAQQGLYADDGQNQYARDVTVEIAAQALDSNGDPTGSTETLQGTVLGSAKTRDGRALSLEMTTSFTGNCRVRVRRVTDHDDDFEGTVVDEVKWERLYSVAPVSKSHFGDVTTVMSMTRATARALALRNRKLNMLVQRKLPARITDGFSTELYGTNSFADALCHAALDPYIGRLTEDEIDVDSIYEAEAAVIAHFGDAKYAEFSATLDDSGETGEETMQAMARAAFCVAYRGVDGKLKVRFDGPQANPTLLFNHRNMRPGSLELVDRFGTGRDHDGIELEYTDPDEDTRETLVWPDHGNVTNPQTIKTRGVRGIDQAWSHLRREWARIVYQDLAAKCTVMQEGALAEIGDKILIADTTVTPTLDGEVIAQSGLTLTLSQNVDWPDPPDLAIWLQLSDGTTEPIDVTLGSAANQVVLAGAPSQTLVVDPNKARTRYVLTAASEADDEDHIADQAFVLERKSPGRGFTWDLEAVNYDARVFAADGVSANTATSLESYTSALIARHSVTPSVYQQESLDRLVVRIGTTLLGKFDLFYLIGGDAQSSLLNWPDASFNATAEGGLSLEPFRYWQADGINDYLNTNYNCNSDATNYALNSASIMVWQSEFTEGDDEYAFGIASGEVQLRPFRDSAVRTQIALNSGSTAVIPIHEQPAGFWGVTRNDSAAMRLYYQEQPGILTFTDITAASTNLPTAGDLYVARRGANYSVMTFPFFALGSGLTDAEVQTVRNEVAAYLARSATS